MDSSFVDMVFASGGTTPIYDYSPIPLFTLVALIAVNFKDLVAAFDFKGGLPVLRMHYKRNSFCRVFGNFKSYLFLKSRFLNDYRY